MTKMNKYILSIIIVIGGGTALLVYFGYQMSDEEGHSAIDYNQLLETNEGSEDKQDQEYKTTIATSFCNVLRKQEKVEIENFNDCVTTMAANPLNVYKSMTQKELSEDWESLAPNEKQLVVQEVQTAEGKIYSDMWEKATYEYLICVNNRSKKESEWLEEKCPSNSPSGSNLYFQDYACQQKIKSTTEYSDLMQQLSCKEPEGG